MDLTKLKESVNNLSEVDPRFDDIFELLGILVDDVADMMTQKTSEGFIRQKRDARDVAKLLYRRIQNTTLKNKDK